MLRETIYVTESALEGGVEYLEVGAGHREEQRGAAGALEVGAEKLEVSTKRWKHLSRTTEYYVTSMHVCTEHVSYCTSLTLVMCLYVP